MIMLRSVQSKWKVKDVQIQHNFYTVDLTLMDTVHFRLQGQVLDVFVTKEMLEDIY